MFKSARYYFRKKSNKTSEPQKRKNYVPIDQDILSAMDVHIQRNMYDETYSPANGYSEFCQCSENILSDEILRLLDSGLTKEEIMMKIKKTYFEDVQEENGFPAEITLPLLELVRSQLFFESTKTRRHKDRGRVRVRHKDKKTEKKTHD